MNTGLTTFDEILNNSLMPWLSENSDPDKFKILLKKIKAAEIKDHWKFFGSLQQAMIEMGIPINDNLNSEWKVLSNYTPEQDNIFYPNCFIEMEDSDPKTAFYSLLIGFSLSALFSWIDKLIHENESETFRKYLIMKTLKKVEILLLQNQPAFQPNDINYSIISRLKIGLAATHIEISKRYAAHVDFTMLRLKKDNLPGFFDLPEETDEQTKKLSQQFRKKYAGFQKEDEAVQSATQQTIIECSNTVKVSENNAPAMALHPALHPHLEIANDIAKDINDLKSILARYFKLMAEKKQSESEDRIGTTEVCQLLGRNKTTIKSYRDKGYLKSWQQSPGGKIEYSKEEVVRLKKLRTKGS